MERATAKGECCGTQKSEQAEANPMAMGMRMAKRMMSQTGQGSSPIDMMQKMMAQMTAGQGKPPVEK